MPATKQRAPLATRVVRKCCVGLCQRRAGQIGVLATQRLEFRHHCFSSRIIDEVRIVGELPVEIGMLFEQHFQCSEITTLVEQHQSALLFTPNRKVRTLVKCRNQIRVRRKKRCG